ALRAAGWTTPVRGCLAATAHAVPLGPVEAIRRPLDSEAIQRALGAHAGRGARVLIVGTDVDFFVALREALGRRGLSVSMAGEARRERAALVRSHLAACRAGVTRSRSRATASAGAPSRASST